MESPKTVNLFESRNDVQKFLDKNITALNPDLHGIAGNCMDGRPITETRVKRGILNYPSYPGAEIGQILTVMAAARSARISEQEVLRGLNTYLQTRQPSNILCHTGEVVDPQNKISGCAALNGALHNPQEYALTSSLANALLNIIQGQNLKPYTLEGQHLESGAIIVVSDPKHPFTVKHHNLSQQAFVIDSLAIKLGLQTIASQMRLKVRLPELLKMFSLHLQVTAGRVKSGVPHLTSGIPVWTVKLNSKGQVIQITEQQSL